MKCVRIIEGMERSPLQISALDFKISGTSEFQIVKLIFHGSPSFVTFHNHTDILTQRSVSHHKKHTE